MIVEWSLDETFKRAQQDSRPACTRRQRLHLAHRPDAAARRFGNLRARELSGSGLRARDAAKPLLGQFRTPPSKRRDLRFVWSGDTAGQGWGIDLGFGGMKIYEAMRQVRPDFFIHSGDTIYADGPMVERVTDASGNSIWTNDFPR